MAATAFAIRSTFPVGTPAPLRWSSTLVDQVGLVQVVTQAEADRHTPALALPVATVN
jgi:hypothetical protein